MSLSLSSLLNPSPDSDGAPPPPHSDALPPNPYAQSPEQHHLSSPHGAYPPQHHYAQHPAADREAAVHALASLSGGSGAPPSYQSQWYGQNAPESYNDRRSSLHEQRPGSSGYNDSVQLPAPSPSMGRKPSSPTLEQYQVASRSPEQRRQSMISPTAPGFTLPPLQATEAKSFDPTRSLTAYQPPGPFQSSAQSTSLKEERSFPDTKYNTDPPVNTSGTDTQVPPPRTGSPPANIKQEAVMTPRATSPLESRRAEVGMSDSESQSVRAITSLKNEHGLRTHSPLRESSIPVQSTEPAMPEPAVSKKRPAPSKTKKGTASTAKKAPPSKKRKVEPKRSVTPSSRASKPFTLRTGSSVGTPADSSPAPSTRSQSDDAYDEPEDDGDDMDDGDDVDGDVYCICRKPDNGTFMIGCDGTCDDWFHGKCVGIEERNKSLIDKYVCPECTKAGVGKTTWKRICRRSGCRQPARVGKTKGGKDGSKYCSEECGVAYFREMVARTRGREEPFKNRSSRRKNSIERGGIDYDLGARGGTLAAGELKSLINSSTTADDFKKLGEGVLSPPATPDSKSPKNGDFAEPETQALQEIHRLKENARHKHQVLKDRTKFVTMVKQDASRTATEKELKPKDYCGYDSRLEWTDEQFGKWRDSPAGKVAFESGTLATDTKDDKDDATLGQHEICDRKKCARHLEWTKLAMDDVRFEMSDNGDRMRALEKEEKGVRERAALRAKAGNLNGEGSVTVHGLGIEMDVAEGVNGPTETMQVDGETVAS